MRYELGDHEWDVIDPMLPNKPRGVPRVDDRHVATRYDKLAANYPAFIQLASIRIWLCAVVEWSEAENIPSATAVRVGFAHAAGPGQFRHRRQEHATSAGQSC
jgi:hypothetical protein